jgi:hypothetical protein
MKSISKSFTYLLLVLIPLQAIAATNMAVCKKMMQATVANEHVSADMPCHKHMGNVMEISPLQEKSNSNTECESYCAAICASLNVISITNSIIKLSDYLVSTSIISKPDQAYASVIQANLLRPPIFLS